MGYGILVHMKSLCRQKYGFKTSWLAQLHWQLLASTNVRCHASVFCAVTQGLNTLGNLYIERVSTTVLQQGQQCSTVCRPGALCADPCCPAEELHTDVRRFKETYDVAEFEARRAATRLDTRFDISGKVRHLAASCAPGLMRRYA